MQLLKWEYETLRHYGRCRIDGEIIELIFHLERSSPVDVLEVEAFLVKTTNQASTVEGYTRLVAEKFGCRVTGQGVTRTHGRITCVYSGEFLSLTDEVQP